MKNGTNNGAIPKPKVTGTRKRGRPINTTSGITTLKIGGVYGHEEAVKSLFDTSATILSERSEITKKRWNTHKENYRNNQMSISMQFRLLEAAGFHVNSEIKFKLNR